MDTLVVGGDINVTLLNIIPIGQQVAGTMTVLCRAFLHSNTTIIREAMFDAMRHKLLTIGSEVCVTCSCVAIIIISLHLFQPTQG